MRGDAVGGTQADELTNKIVLRISLAQIRADTGNLCAVDDHLADEVEQIVETGDVDADRLVVGSGSPRWS